jgi:hypothetical protein
MLNVVYILICIYCFVASEVHVLEYCFNYSEIDSVIKDWLRFAKERDGGEKKELK